MDTINNGRTSNSNRGVELIINEKNPNTKKFFVICADKIISIFNRDIIISFHFSLDLRKQK